MNVNDTPPATDALLKSVLKALAALDCFSTRDRKLTVSEIAHRTGMPRGTAHRVVTTLREAGLLDQERDRFRLGIKLFELGNVFLANMDLQREARSFVGALTELTGEVVHLCVFDGRQTTLVKRAEPTRERTNRIMVLEASPAYCTSTGKAALAFQPRSVVNRVISFGLHGFTVKTITDPAQLLQELEETRRRGYAIDDEEYSLGIRCVGAPIRNVSGRVFASISVSGPARRMTRAKLDATAKLVVQYADGISAQLGYRPYRTTGRRRARSAVQEAA